MLLHCINIRGGVKRVGGHYLPREGNGFGCSVGMSRATCVKRGVDRNQCRERPRTKVGGTHNSTGATSDLRGIWQNFTLTVFEDGSQNYQQRGKVCIENDGSYVATNTESDGDTDSGPGTFLINATTGVVSEFGDAFQGALDAGKTVLAYVDMDDEDDPDVGLQVGVMIKTNFLPITFSCP